MENIPMLYLKNIKSVVKQYTNIQCVYIYVCMYLKIQYTNSHGSED